MVHADIRVSHKGLVGEVDGDAGFDHDCQVLEDLLPVSYLDCYPVHFAPTLMFVGPSSPLVLIAGLIRAILSLADDLEYVLLNGELGYEWGYPFAFVEVMAGSGRFNLYQILLKGFHREWWCQFVCRFVLGVLPTSR